MSATSVVICRLGDLTIGFSVDHIREIIQYTPPMPVPKSPEYVAGFITVRDQSISVIHLASYLSIATHKPPTRVVITECTGVTTGVTVDAVIEAMPVLPEYHQPIPSHLSNLAPFLTAVLHTPTYELVLVMDLVKLLNLSYV